MKKIFLGLTLAALATISFLAPSEASRHLQAAALTVEAKTFGPGNAVAAQDLSGGHSFSENFSDKGEYVERIAFLEEMGAQLDMLALSGMLTDFAISLGWVSLPLILIGCCCAVFSASPWTAEVLWASAIAAISFLVVPLWPSNNSHIAQVVMIESAVTGLSISETLKKQSWDKPLSKTYVSNYRASMYSSEVRTRINDEKLRLKSELTR